MVAISVDPPAVSEKLAAHLGLRFPLASDPEGAVIKAFGVFDPENEIAWPSVFVIEQDGTVSYRWLATTYKVRVTPDELLRALPARSP